MLHRKCSSIKLLLSIYLCVSNWRPRLPWNSQFLKHFQWHFNLPFFLNQVFPIAPLIVKRVRFQIRESKRNWRTLPRNAWKNPIQWWLHSALTCKMKSYPHQCLTKTHETETISSAQCAIKKQHQLKLYHDPLSIVFTSFLNHHPLLFSSS